MDSNVAVSVNINNTQIRNNVAIDAGGGLFISKASKAVFELCTIVGNKVTKEVGGGGGGIQANRKAQVTLINSKCHYNVAVMSQGGCLKASIATIHSFGSSLSHNAALSGGAIEANDTTTTCIFLIIFYLFIY